MTLHFYGFHKPLSKYEGNNVVLVVIDRLAKFSHFLALSHPFSAEKVAKLFLENVVKSHEIPVSMVSDRDKIFTNNFWQKLFKSLGIKLYLSLAYHHPQSDGQLKDLRGVRRIT